MRNSIPAPILAKGVISGDFQEITQTYPDLSKQYLSPVLNKTQHPFTAWKEDLLNTSLFIYIPPGTRIETPIQFDGRDKRNVSFERLVIVVAEGSSGDFIHGCAAPIYLNKAFKNRVVECIVEKNATLNYSVLQNYKGNANAGGISRATLAENARMRWSNITLGEQVLGGMPRVNLAGKGASCEIDLLMWCNPDATPKIPTEVNHQISPSQSRINTLLINDCSQQTKLDFKFSQTDKGPVQAAVYCESIFLKPTAKVESPGINIDTNISNLKKEFASRRLSADDIFYMKSRGMGEELARSMLLKAATKPIISRLPMEYGVEIEQIIELKLKQVL